MNRRSEVVVLSLVAGVTIATLLLVSSISGVRSVGIWAITVAVVLALVVGALLFAAVARSRAGRTPPPTAPEIAARLGLTYEKKVERGFHREHGPLPGIPAGGDVRHLFRGTVDGWPMHVFQHTYVINTGQAVIPIHHAVYLTDAPPWPGVTVAPRRGLARLWYRLGRHRGLLLEDDGFNAAFKVRTDDEDFALTLLHPAMQALLLEKPGVSWRVHAGCVALVYSGAVRFDRMETSIDRLRRFWSQVPEELLAW